MARTGRRWTPEDHTLLASDLLLLLVVVMEWVVGEVGRGGAWRGVVGRNGANGGKVVRGGGRVGNEDRNFRSTAAMTPLGGAQWLPQRPQ